MSKNYDLYSHFDDYDDYGYTHKKKYLNAITDDGRKFEEEVREFSRRAKESIDQNHRQKEMLDAVNRLLKKETAHQSTYYNEFFEEDEDYGEDDVELFDYEVEEEELETSDYSSQTINNLRKNALINALRKPEPPSKSNDKQVSTIEKLTSNAISVKFLSWKYWPRWASAGAVAVGAFAVIPGFVTMNLINLAITGGCLVVTSGTTFLTWGMNKKLRKREDARLWNAMANKWGKESQPEDEDKAQLLNSVRRNGNAKWYSADKAYVMVYNPVERTYELSQEKRKLGEGSQIELSSELSLWSTYFDDRKVPDQTASYLKSLQTTLKRLPMEKLDAVRQHQIQRIMQDSVEAVNIYDNLGEFTESDDEDLQVLNTVLSNLDEEAKELIETEIASLRNQLEVHAIYVANRTKEEN